MGYHILWSVIHREIVDKSIQLWTTFVNGVLHSTGKLSPKLSTELSTTLGHLSTELSTFLVVARVYVYI